MAAEKPWAVVLLSGGMDSCVTAAIAARDHRLAVLHSSYGQRTEARELRAFHEIADFLKAGKRLQIEQRYMGEIGGSALTDPSLEIPGADPGADRARAGSGGVPITYVPFRNAHLLAAAVSWAEVIGARTVFVGAVEQDSSGYPDCRPNYYRVFNDLIETGTRPESKIEIRTPLIERSKCEIVRQGLELGAPLRLTWSCYGSSEKACGVCDSCALRRRAFEQAGETDPVA